MYTYNILTCVSMLASRFAQSEFVEADNLYRLLGPGMTIYSKVDSIANNGVTCDRYVLSHIMSRQHAIAQKTLAARATLDPMAVERLLESLQSRGITSRRWCLTNKGRAVYKRLKLSRRRRAAKGALSKRQRTRRVDAMTQ